MQLGADPENKKSVVPVNGTDGRKLPSGRRACVISLVDNAPLACGGWSLRDEIMHSYRP